MNIRLDAAVVDSSALISIVKGESAADLFAREMADVHRLYMSAATHAEVMLATLSIQHQAGILGMQRLLSELDVEIIDFGKSDLDLYLACAFQYHLKASPSGPLNMGDLFSFQLAMKMDLPLFFQGKDFLKTPVKNAMALPKGQDQQCKKSRGQVVHHDAQSPPIAPALERTVEHANGAGLGNVKKPKQ
jgi:ribonuclease VapC